MVDREVLTIKFDGQAHQVEVSTFTQTLLDFATVLQEANRHQESGAEIRVMVSAPERGSLDAGVIVELLQSEAAFVFGSLAGAAGDIIGMVAALYSFRRNIARHGDVESIEASGDAVVVSHSRGTTTIVDNRTYNFYLSSAEANDAISRTFSELDDEQSITALDIIDEGESLFRAEREDFAAMAIRPSIDSPKTTSDTEIVSLIVLKVVLERNLSRKWEFLLRGVKMSANITDEDFFDSIDAGMRFGKGDVLHAELEIEKEWDESISAYMVKRYIVRRVLSHRPHQRDSQLFDSP